MSTQEMSTIKNEELALISGGDTAEAGHTFGHAIGTMYWGARDYLSEVVFPYWLD